MEKVVIIGSGCAGLTAAIYTSRANLNPLVLVGADQGGQLALTTDVENFPGFPEGIMGAEVMDFFDQQAKRFGARLEYKTVLETDIVPGGPQRLTLDDGSSLACEALIIATGARPRWLGLPSEEALKNKGVSACATCDGALYRDVPVAVVGGGDTALEEALFLTRFASQVTLIHRRDELRGSKIMQQRVFDNKKITILWDSVVDKVLGEDEDGVTGLTVKNTQTGELSTLTCAAVFVAIGHIPNTDPFKGQLDMDDAGYIITPDGGRSLTSVEGVFVAGDCADHVYRQAVTAAGMGCRAAIDCERWLAGKE
ncbi:MAG: thioredoxin-disulfide reductase [Lentisphaeria bacterium]|nr:thioredoxin-disulfide reductase [Lentisphaeria bacterium]